MGEPKARNLLRAGIPLLIWARSPQKCEALVAQGEEQAASPEDLFEHSTAVMLMLLDSGAIDAVLCRRTPAFAKRVCGRTIVLLGTPGSCPDARPCKDPLARAVLPAFGVRVMAKNVISFTSAAMQVS